MNHATIWPVISNIIMVFVCDSYPFNNMLHHHVESIVTSCLESNNQELIDHLFQDCKFLDKLLAADEDPYAPDIQVEVNLATR